MRRLFIAIEFPGAIRQKILDIEDDFKRSVEGNFVDKDKLHITLLFLGDTGIDTDRIIDALRPLKTAMTIEVGGIGVFPPRGEPHTLFMDIKTDLNGVYSEVCSALDIKEPRDFHPHVTICRIKSINWDISKLFERHSDNILKFETYGPSLFNSDFENYSKIF